MMSIFPVFNRIEQPNDLRTAIDVNIAYFQTHYPHRTHEECGDKALEQLVEAGRVVLEETGVKIGQRYDADETWCLIPIPMCPEWIRESILRKLDTSESRWR